MDAGIRTDIDVIDSLLIADYIAWLEFKVPSKRDHGGFTLKTHQVFSVHTTPEKSENTTINGHFRFVFAKPRAGKSHDYRDAIVFELKAPSLRCLLPHENEKPAFSNSTSMKSVFEKLRFS